MDGIPSDQEIDQVHKYIEQCIQHYMNKKETIDILAIQANIEPAFTKIVWEKLEQDNKEFFKAYYVRSVVKDQIIEFNRLLSKQAELMHQNRHIEINNGLNSNGSHIPTWQISRPNAAQSSRESLQQQLNMLSNNVSWTQSFLRVTSHWSIHRREIGVSPFMGLDQRMNVQIVRREIEFAGTSAFIFNAPSNILESSPVMGDDNVESNATHPDDYLLDAEENPELPDDH